MSVVVLAGAPALAAIGRVSARPPMPRPGAPGSLVAVGRLSGHSSPVTAVAFSPSGAVVAAASADGGVRLWETAAGREPRAIATGQGVAESLAFSPDGTRLATGGRDGTLKLWRVATGVELRAVHHDETAAVVALAFAPDGATLVAGGQSGLKS
jgi:WD40 repeat protein